VSTQVAEPQQVVKKQRGRETAADMVRSLGLVVLVILPVWFFAKAPASDEATIRVVDPTSTVSAFSADVPDAPVPGELPESWRATSATYSGVERTLRVGWVTPSEQYAEYAATTGDREDFLEAVVGQQADPAAAVTVGGTEWDVFVEPDGSTSYVQAYGQATVVVGTKRATAGQEELAVLLGSLTTG
jgi:hypothetical protein